MTVKRYAALTLTPEEGLFQSGNVVGHLLLANKKI